MAVTLEQIMAKLEAIEKKLDMRRPLSGRPADINAVLELVAETYGISMAVFTSKERPAHLAWPRQVAMMLIATQFNIKVETVGHIFKRDHTTVCYAIKTVNARCKIDTRERVRVFELMAKVQKLSPVPVDTAQIHSTSDQV